MAVSTWQILIANMAIIVAFAMVWSAISERIQHYRLSFAQIAFGFYCGISATIVMSLPIALANGVFADLRAVPLALAGFFFGPSAALIAWLVSSLFRAMLGGIGLYSGLSAIAVATLVGLSGKILLSQWPSFSYVNSALSFSNALMTVVGILLLPTDIRQLFDGETIFAIFALVWATTLISAFAISRGQDDQKVRKQNAIYAELINALPDCLNAKGIDGKFIVANPSTAQLMGALSVEGLIGKTDFDFYEKEDAEEFLKDEERIVSNGMTETLEQKYVRPDGKIAWLNSLKAPFYDRKGVLQGVITHNRDITHQKELELRLQEVNQRFSEALSHMVDGLVMFDRFDKLVYCNDQYLHLFPRSAHLRVQGADLFDILIGAVSTGDVVLPAGEDVDQWASELVRTTRMFDTTIFTTPDGRYVEKRTRPGRNGTYLTVYSDITQQARIEHQNKELITKLDKLSRIDGLTGLLNRRIFDETIHSEIARANRYESSLGLIMVDVDYFKLYNDTYGHPAGDECLRQVALVLKDLCRREADTVFRYGGEEFALLLPGLELNELKAFSEELRLAVRNRAITHSSSPHKYVSISLGFTVYDSKISEANSLLVLENADKALYSAKAIGRNAAFGFPIYN